MIEVVKKMMKKLYMHFYEIIRLRYIIIVNLRYDNNLNTVFFYYKNNSILGFYIVRLNSERC